MHTPNPNPSPHPHPNPNPNPHQVGYDERKVDVPSLLARVTSGGYQAEVMAGDNLANLSSSFDVESRQWRRRFVGRRVCVRVHVHVHARRGQPAADAAHL